MPFPGRLGIFSQQAGSELAPSGGRFVGANAGELRDGPLVALAGDALAGAARIEPAAPAALDVGDGLALRSESPLVEELAERLRDP
jgi:hypothetical protein